MDPVWCTVLKQAGFCQEAQRKCHHNSTGWIMGVFVYLLYQRKKLERFAQRAPRRAEIESSDSAKGPAFWGYYWEPPEYQTASTICIWISIQQAGQVEAAQAGCAAREQLLLAQNLRIKGENQVHKVPIRINCCPSNADMQSSTSYPITSLPPSPNPLAHSRHMKTETWLGKVNTLHLASYEEQPTLSEGKDERGVRIAEWILWIPHIHTQLLCQRNTGMATVCLQNPFEAEKLQSIRITNNPIEKETVS